MRLSAPFLQNVLEWDVMHPGLLILENPRLFRHIVWDLSEQKKGEEGNIVISEDFRSLDYKKEMVIIRDLYEVDLNDKKVMNAVMADMKTYALDEMFVETQQIIGEINSYTQNLIQSSMMPLSFEEVTEITPLLKMAGVRLDNEKDPLDRLLDYAYTVQDYLKVKLIVLVNIRAYLTQDEYVEMCRELGMRGIYTLFIESMQQKRVVNEHMLLIDSDKCELMFDGE